MRLKLDVSPDLVAMLAEAIKAGRGVATVPIFLLVPQVKLRKRLDLARDAERAHEAVLGLIVAK
jgi:hypothetical protein